MLPRGVRWLVKRSALTRRKVGPLLVSSHFPLSLKKLGFHRERRLIVRRRFPAFFSTSRVRGDSVAGHGKFRLLQVTGYVSFYTAGQSCTMSMYFAIVVTLNLIHGCTELDSRMYYVQTHSSTMANQTAVATVQYKLFSTFVSAGPGDSKLMFRLIHFWKLAIIPKEASLSEPNT
ncbi:hypothetical protein YC2023_121391 [Brassica napus]